MFDEIKDLIPIADTGDSDGVTEESESLDDTSTKDTDEGDKESEESTEDTGEGSEPLEESATPEKTEEEGEDKEESEEKSEDELESFKDSHKKTGVEKRIDKLSAKLKELEDENTKLKEGKSEKKSEPTYTRAQLVGALEQAAEKGDGSLMLDIFDYKLKEMEESLTKKYEDEQQSKVNANEAVGKEWSSIVEDYTYLSDPDEPEIYKGSRKDLKLGDQTSLLYRLAYDLYMDRSKVARYRKDGGQRIAVSDALAKIMKKKRGRLPDAGENTKLKKRLAKAKRKTSLSGGRSGREETESSTLKTNSDTLKEYIAERKKTSH